MSEAKGGRATALILAGAVAKGAFEAGVLSVVARHAEKLAIRRVVGASAGAINAAVFAAGILAGREVEAATRIDRLWRERGGWHDVFKFSLSDALHLRGAGTTRDVLAVLSQAIEGWTFDGGRAIDLRIVLTKLAGELASIGKDDATTYEYVAKFDGRDFGTPAGWDRIAKTAIGSGSFPIVYAPASVPGAGPCIDGGIVDNTPVKWAIEGGIDRVIVVSAHPQVVARPASFEGADLLGEFVDILINERLYRDLREALSVNDRLAKIDGLVAAGSLSAGGRDAVVQALGWRPLEIVQIRPKTPLEGTAFSAFGDANLRAQYIRQGELAAAAVLER